MFLTDGHAEVYIGSHKGINLPRFPHLGNQLRVPMEAFLADFSTWKNLDNVPDGRIIVPRFCAITIYRYQDIRFCLGFGAVLEKAERAYNADGIEWPPDIESTEILVHGVSTCMVQVVFWSQVTVLTNDHDCHTLTGGTAWATTDRVRHSARLHQH